MQGKGPELHLTESLLDRYAEGDLDAPDRERVAVHLEGCPSCRRTARAYAALASSLAALPVPEVPAGFAMRVLDAVLPAPSEDALLIRIATRAYVTLAVVLAAIGAAVLGVSGPTPVTDVVVTGFTRALGGYLSTLRDVVIGSVDVTKVFLELAPVAGAFGSLARGLETAALALSPVTQVVLALTVLLATLVLVWAIVPARERGVPHVYLSL
jgi:Putative zinc-finger